MFKKTTRRNLRQRKDESSEDDESIRDEGGGPRGESSVHSNDQVKVKGGSASSSPSYRVSENGASAESLHLTKETHSPRRTTLSFLHEKESSGEVFKLKRPEDKIVVFQARKKEKENSPVKSTFIQKDRSYKEEYESSSAEDIPPDSNDDAHSTTSSSSKSSSGAKPQAVTIPNAERIRGAKEQRRRTRAQCEYIPLNEDQKSEGESGYKKQEESDEEQDSNDESDDHERRIEFAPKPKSLRQRMAETMDTSGSEGTSFDSQEEEDQNLWEEQQIGKGVTRHQQIKTHRSSPRNKKKVDIPQTLSPVNIAIIKKRITETLTSLKEVHRAREAELRRMQLDLESAKTSMENLESHLPDTQLYFFRSMNVFIKNLVDCLSEKTSLINSVELDVHSLYIDQAEALLSKRRESVQKQSAYLQQLTYSGNVHDKDEILKTTTAKDRELFEDGYGCVVDDLEATEEQEAELQSKKAEILERSQQIFIDVHKDFSDVKKILSRFNEWRVSFSESYTNAYISLCLPKLLSPLIRHQLIGWNPLKTTDKDFEELPWFSAVEQFCHGQGYEESEISDTKTLPAIIEKTLLPKMQGFVELVWDPLSLKESQCLTGLCKRIQEDYSVFHGDQSKPVKAFVEAVIQKLRSAVENDVFVPFYPKVFLDDKSSPQYRFQNEQFWSAVKLLGNISLWDGLIPEYIQKELMLDKLLNRYLMMTLLNESDPKHIQQKCKRVADCFPKSWFVDLDTYSTIPQLQNFSKHLLQTADKLCKANSEPTSSRSFLTEVIMTLWTIKDYESLNLLAEKNNCQDLLDLIIKS